jgi:hypothetical protein
MTGKREHIILKESAHCIAFQKRKVWWPKDAEK